MKFKLFKASQLLLHVKNQIILLDVVSRLLIAHSCETTALTQVKIINDFSLPCYFNKTSFVCLKCPSISLHIKIYF